MDNLNRPLIATLGTTGGSSSGGTSFVVVVVVVILLFVLLLFVAFAAAEEADDCTVVFTTALELLLEGPIIPLFVDAFKAVDVAVDVFAEDDTTAGGGAASVATTAAAELVDVAAIGCVGIAAEGALALTLAGGDEVLLLLGLVARVSIPPECSVAVAVGLVPSACDDDLAVVVTTGGAVGG